ncbi:MAG: DUF2505 domain-containing protein [Bifidobacteriaceae bacterium]|nr:DUF2505 domain-containing protein [Bifidobacteriaceae bacterium]
MRFAAHYDYSAKPDAVAALLADRDFLAAAAARAGAPASRVEVSPGPDGGFTVTVRASLETASLPASMRALAPQGLELRQALVWTRAGEDGSRQATMAGEVAGSGVQLSGLALLRPTAAGTRLQFAGEVKAQVPLLGRMIENAAVPAIIGFSDAQHQVIEDWLAAT